MFKIGQKVVDKETNNIGTIIQVANNFCLVMYENNLTEGKFTWELEKCNLLEILKRKVGIKNGRK